MSYASWVQRVYRNTSISGHEHFEVVQLEAQEFAISIAIFNRETETLGTLINPQESLPKFIDAVDMMNHITDN